MDKRNAKLNELKGRESGERCEVKRERTKYRKGKIAEVKVKSAES
jgi:hypothetical protein